MWWIIGIIGGAVLIGIIYGVVIVAGQNKGDKQLAQSGFTITRTIYSLRIDDKNRKWCINKGLGEIKMYDFSEVVDCKIEENSVLNKVNKLGVYIYTLNNGALYIDLINNATKRDSVMYNSNMNFAQQIYAAVQSMKAQPGTFSNIPVPVSAGELASAAGQMANIAVNTGVTAEDANDVLQRVTAGTVDDIEEQLKKYKSMVDSGIITQEDYEAKKKQLLGL